MRFNPKDYGNNAVMCCRNQRESKIFAKFLNRIGKCRYDGSKYPETRPVKHSYYFNSGYCSSSSYETLGSYTYNHVLRFSDFDWSIEREPVYDNTEIDRFLGSFALIGEVYEI